MTDAVSRVVEPESETGPAGGEIEAAEPPPVRTARRTPWLVRAAGVAMLALAGWWAVHDVDWASMPAALANVSPSWIGVAALVNLLAVYAMAARWRALLNPLAPLVTQAQAFKALLMGFAVSTIVPARAGELARAEWLARRSGLPRATVLGSIVLDQLVNAVGLFVGIAALPFVVEMPGWLHSGLWLAVLVFLVVSALVFVFQPRAGQPTLAGAQPQGRAGAVAGFLARARLGLAAVRDRRALARSAGASLLAWLVEVNVVVITLHAFGLHPSAGVSLLVLMAVNLALVVPFAPPGNLGTLEVGAMLALMQYGVPKEKALAFALVYHLLQVVPIGIAGLSLAGHSLIRPSSATPGRPASSPTN